MRAKGSGCSCMGTERMAGGSWTLGGSFLSLSLVERLSFPGRCSDCKA